MKKLVFLVSMFLLVSVTVAWGVDRSIIDKNDLSIKAGPTEPGEALAMVWLESYVYPKVVKDDRVISLGVRATSKVKDVVAGFDFGSDKVKLTSYDGMSWSGAYKLPDNVANGLHIVRYEIVGDSGTVKRTVDFFVQSQQALVKNDQVAEGEAIYVQSWPLTVKDNCVALVDGSTRILYSGEKVIGISKVPWYKVILEDGEEAWVSSSQVKEPIDEYYMLGVEAYSDKDFISAIEYFKSAVAIKPDYVTGHLWLAKSYDRAGDHQAAYESILEAIRLDERNMPARVVANQLATYFFEQGKDKFQAKRFNESIAAYGKVVNLKPSSANSWIELGRCYEALGLPGEARDAWRQAARVQPNISAPRVAVVAAAPKKPVAKKPVVVKKVTSELPPALADDSLEIVREAKTNKGTTIGSALKSVIALTKSLGTPVIEKGWQAKKQGDKFLVRYLCEQGAGVLEAFDWKVDIDTGRVSANNDNARLLMKRW